MSQETFLETLETASLFMTIEKLESPPLISQQNFHLSLNFDNDLHLRTLPRRCRGMADICVTDHLVEKLMSARTHTRPIALPGPLKHKT